MAGNHAVAHLLADPIQRAADQGPQPAAGQPAAGQVLGADALVAQHGAAVEGLRAGADRLTTESPQPEDAADDELSAWLAEAETLQARVEADAAVLEAAADPAPEQGQEGAGEEAGDPIQREAADDRTVARAHVGPSPSVVVQRGKTTSHEHNYLKRTKGLSVKMKKQLKPGGGKAYDDFRTARREAKRYATKLDRNRSAAELKYQVHIKKSTHAPHPEWQILKHAVLMHQHLSAIGVMKEHVRWFQHRTLSYTRRSMRAVLLPGAANLMIGSNTGGTSDLYWGEPILAARKGSRGSALYIKGHLLNDHLGGAGLAHNLVPLTADKLRGPKNKTGSNDANGEHNKQIEEPIKRLLTGKGQIKSSLTYRVDSLAPNPGPGRTAQTQQVRAYADAFDAAAKAPANARATTPEIRDGLAAAHPALAPVGPGLLAAIVTGHLKPPATAAALLLDNASLWEKENQVIPEGIECSASYVANGNLTVPTTKSGQPMTRFRILNVLPTKFTAPYKP